MTTPPCPKCSATWPHACWEVFDFWRCVWEAMALADGKPAGTGLEAHKQCWGEFDDQNPDTCN